MATTKSFHPEQDLTENVRTRFFIDGRWATPLTNERLDLISPVTETLTLSLPGGSPADMNVAVEAARRAFDTGPWPGLSHAERAGYLRKIAEQLRRRGDLLMRTWTAQVGAPAWFTSRFTERGAVYFDYFAGLAETFAFEDIRVVAHGRAKVIREPVGVCALIVPWNSPLILLAQKLAPALLAGCTAVVKPSPETPLDALILAECVDAAGLPPGVVNIVPAGREAGDWLVRQPQIDKVGFTGSTAAGKHIAKICADRVARMSLELGGKSASIFCDDADMSLWLKSVAPFTMPFSGQICFSQTRVLVSKRRHDEVLEAFASGVERMRVGDPWDAETDIGPLSMARQLDRVLGHIETGKREGARLVTGGGRATGINRGYFVAPTVFDSVTRDMAIAREEVFGPVVCVMTYEDEDEAVSIANDSDFGLSGTVFAADVERAEAIARRVRTGNITINGLQLDPMGPFGGFKQSGLGREGGPEGLAPYLETKTVYLPA